MRNNLSRDKIQATTNRTLLSVDNSLMEPSLIMQRRITDLFEDLAKTEDNAGGAEQGID